LPEGHRFAAFRLLVAGGAPGGLGLLLAHADAPSARSSVAFGASSGVGAYGTASSATAPAASQPTSGDSRSRRGAEALHSGGLGGVYGLGATAGAARAGVISVSTTFIRERLRSSWISRSRPSCRMRSSIPLWLLRSVLMRRSLLIHWPAVRIIEGRFFG